MTRKTLLASLVAGCCVAGFCESLPLSKMGKPVPSNKLEVRWNVPTNTIPTTLWVYRVVPTEFAPAVISNLMAVGRFTAKDKAITPGSGPEGIIRFLSPDKTRTLSLDPASGLINYDDSRIVQTTLTNLPVGVPQERELPELTTNFLPKLGLSTSEIERREGSIQAAFSLFEPEMAMYITNSVIITNIPYRSVLLRRSLDGVAFIGNDSGGNCWISFASHATISKISLKWPNVERLKSYPAAQPQTIAKWINQGKAVHGYIPVDVGRIDWTTAKRMTVTKAEASYVTGRNFIYPIASLWTTVDTGHGHVDLEIDCPITDETKTK